MAYRRHEKYRKEKYFYVKIACAQADWSRRIHAVSRVTLSDVRQEKNTRFIDCVFFVVCVRFSVFTHCCVHLSKGKTCAAAWWLGHDRDRTAPFRRFYLLPNSLFFFRIFLSSSITARWFAILKWRPREFFLFLFSLSNSSTSRSNDPDANSTIRQHGVCGGDLLNVHTLN